MTNGFLYASLTTTSPRTFELVCSITLPSDREPTDTNSPENDTQVTARIERDKEFRVLITKGLKEAIENSRERGMTEDQMLVSLDAIVQAEQIRLWGGTAGPVWESWSGRTPRPVSAPAEREDEAREQGEGSWAAGCVRFSTLRMI